jgi:hypothetical protein
MALDKKPAVRVSTLNVYGRNRKRKLLVGHKVVPSRRGSIF